ncbi:2-acyl-glycerophospho-ethanolamine acyltransferase [Marinomonas spartinae]|uniref:L-ornithine N(alpha)-acyltransferase n=1 Tax=Marinomonas spartinae TaxID=1792290 RepID=A0A1A8TNL2_9GAMM|nr:lysophospholipid acyltransferase family protein [Marinomonas spartinae]SBS34820.1 2-acyl-glycerophospho-ethanolamine acyltransferase [Marinomonas spartinae]SBS38282.1 2-acyl-glycerophospho-ethanolamine acyltransferase [Marinomonas spartinae]
MSSSPFRLPHFTPFGVGESLVEWATGLAKLDRIYQQRPQGLSSFEFMRYTLSALNIEYDVSLGSIDNIPKEGPVVIVANHPLGAIEGVILAELIGSVRPDVKVLANEMLKRLPEIRELFIGVNVFGGAKAKKTNSLAIVDANRHLAEGGLLIIFPAGEVSSYAKGSKQLLDIEWRNSVAKFVKHSKATTVPIFINGKNSALFYGAGRVHPLLRTALLARELLNKKLSRISISIGSPISFSEVSEFENDKDMVNYFRLNTYLMGAQHKDVPQALGQNHDLPIIDALDSVVLEREIAQLPSSDLLLVQGDYAVYCSYSQNIPNLMREIGRIREVCFRSVGEGSGLSCDVDDYDAYYRQLFVWHKKDKQIVGAYRLGQVDQLIEQKGLSGLYSRSLFSYDQAFINSLDKSIEIGRSVVALPYQKSLNSLLMLWKGIARFVSLNPSYTHLFGPVSISNDYSMISRQLLAETLSIHYYDQEKASLVSPLSPMRKSGNAFWQPNLLSSLTSVSLLSKVVSRLDQGKGVPVLLRQYLKMNGKLVCFNIDPAFHDCLDGLIVVDIKSVPLPTLAKYMGQNEAQAYLSEDV